MPSRRGATPLPPAHRIAGRALRTALSRRCPNCHTGRIWTGWLTLGDRCPDCGIAPARGEHDFFIGAVMVNFVLAELVTVLTFVAAMILMWPAVNWDALLWGTVALAIAAPIATYPFTMTLWLALDMTFRPPGRET